MCKVAPLDGNCWASGKFLRMFYINMIVTCAVNGKRIVEIESRNVLRRWIHFKEHKLVMILFISNERGVVNYLLQTKQYSLETFSVDFHIIPVLCWAREGMRKGHSQSEYPELRTVTDLIDIILRLLASMHIGTHSRRSHNRFYFLPRALL